MVLARSRMKQADSAAHSSGRNGGESLVLEKPAAGVLQKMPIATDCTVAPQVYLRQRCTGSEVPSPHKASRHRHGGYTISWGRRVDRSRLARSELRIGAVGHLVAVEHQLAHATALHLALQAARQPLDGEA